MCSSACVIRKVTIGVICSLMGILGLALHEASAAEMYWSNYSAGRIQKANLDGSNMQDLVIVSGPQGLALDTINSRLYFVAGGNSAIRRCDLDGNNVADILTGLSGPYDVALDLVNSRMYFITQGDGKVQRSNLDGTGRVDLLTGVPCCHQGIKVDPVNGYVFLNQYSGTIIQRTDLNGGGLTNIVNQGFSGGARLSVDIAGGKVYWAEYGQNRLWRANYDGTGFQMLRQLTSAFSVDVDPIGGKLYYGDRSPGSIARSDLDGSNPQTLVNGIDPLALVVSGDTDCNSNGAADGNDIAGPTSADCNTNGLPDECEIATGSPAPGGPFFCTSDCDPDCNNDGIPDSCDIAGPTSDDCNGNSTPDECDIAGLTSIDCNNNATPDECDADCNTNTIPDDCDIAAMTSGDCDDDGIPDECQGATGDVFWIGADGGSYHTASNWNPTGVPTGGARAVLAHAGSSDNRCILTAAGTTTVCAAHLEASGSGDQILRIPSGSRLWTNQGATVAIGGKIELRDGELAGGPLDNSSNTVEGYGAISADVFNTGLMEARPGANDILRLTGASLDNLAGGVMRSALGSLLLIESPSLSQFGELESRTFSGISFAASSTNSPGGAIHLLGGSIGSSGPGGITNDVGGLIDGFGTIDCDVTNDGETVVVADTQVVGNLDNDGTITVQSGLLTVTGNVSGSGSIIGGFGGRSGEVGIRVAGDWTLGTDAALIAPSGRFTIGGRLDVAIDDSARMDLSNATVVFSSRGIGGMHTIEAMARDAGVNASPFDRTVFPIGVLRVDSGATLALADRHVNNAADGRKQPAAEAVYVRRLELAPGATLDLAGQHLYCASIQPSDALSPDSRVRVIDSRSGGGLHLPAAARRQ